MRSVVALAVPGSLVTAAVLSLGTPAYAAPVTVALAPVECGQPAQPAVTREVTYPAVYETRPAVTHREWRWTRSIPGGTDVEFAREVSGAYDVYDWSRTTSDLQDQYSRTVIDQEAQPAVYEVEYEYFHTQNPRQPRRWYTDDEWNAQPNDNSHGWERTGATRDGDLITPAVPEVSHVEYLWVDQGDAAPAGWTATGETQEVNVVTEHEQLPEGETPAGLGWILGEVVDTVEAVIDLIWLPEGEEPPAGYTATGRTETEDATVETTDETSESAPAGDGWAIVDGSEVVVVDVPETQVLVTEARTETVVVTPAVPAGEECVNVDTSGQGDNGASGGAVVDKGDAVLPATGAGNEPLLLGAGLLALFTGGALVRGGKHRKA